MVEAGLREPSGWGVPTVMSVREFLGFTKVPYHGEIRIAHALWAPPKGLTKSYLCVILGQSCSGCGMSPFEWEASESRSHQSLKKEV